MLYRRDGFYLRSLLNIIQSPIDSREPSRNYCLRTFGWLPQYINSRAQLAKHLIDAQKPASIINFITNFPILPYHFVPGSSHTRYIKKMVQQRLIPDFDFRFAPFAVQLLFADDLKACLLSRRLKVLLYSALRHERQSLKQSLSLQGFAHLCRKHVVNQHRALCTKHSKTFCKTLWQINVK